MSDEDPGLVGREALAREPNTDLPLRIPALGTSLRIVARAFTLRCPSCGGRPVLHHWWKMRHTCGQCGLDLERGESDYFIGSMMFNLVIGEGIFALIFIALMWWQWPTVPWEAIQWGLPIGLLLMPAILFPVAKLAWLGFDLAMRPGPGDTR